MLQDLRNIFNKKYSQILIIGIGNYLRSDDGVAPRIVEQLKPSGKVQVLNVETNIERYIEPIQNSKADVLLFIDCVHFGKEPGYAAVIPIDEVKDSTFHSHNISLNRIKDFFSMPAYVLGIEPATIEVSETLSPKVHETAVRITQMLSELITE